MKIPVRVFLLCFIFCSQAAFAPAAEAPVAQDPIFTPEQARQILQTSDDLSDIVAALNVAIADPASRSAAIEYFNRPLDTNVWDEHLRSLLPPGTDLHSEKTSDAIYVNISRCISDLAAFFNTHQTPEIFEIFKRFNESIMAAGQSFLIQYAEQVQVGSAVEPLVIDYVKQAMFDKFIVMRTEVVDGQAEERALGVFDVRTGEWHYWLTQARIAKLAPSPEVRVPLLGNNGIIILFGMNSRAADYCIQQILASPEYWNTPSVQVEFDALVGNRRYDPRVIAFAHNLLLNRYEKDKQRIVKEFLEPRWLGDDTGHAGQPLEKADPSVYPQLLAFIADAEQHREFNDATKKIIADTKTKIIELQRLHAPPTPPQGYVYDPNGKLVNMSTKASSDNLPYNPYHFESGLYPPFPWQAKVLIPITILLVLWWFWHEWKTWPK